MEILDEITKSYVQDVVRKGKRPDERSFDQYRPISISKRVVPNAEGSCLAKIGRTKVLSGVKFDLATPFPDRPTEGVLSTNAELLPMASPSFEPGPPDARSIELARVVDRGIRSAGIIDLNSFFLVEGKVLAVYVDLYVLDHGGNLLDTAALAAMGALTDARMPKIENDKIIRGEYTGQLKLADKVVATTFAKVDSTILVDPSIDEEAGMSGRMTIATTSSRVVAGQKGGPGAFTPHEMLDLVDLAFKKGNELRALI